MFTSLFTEFKESLAAIRKNKFDHFFLLIQFIYFSGLVRQFGTDEFLVLNTLFTGVLCLQTKKVTWREIRHIFIVLILFVLITAFPTLIHGIDVRLFIGYSIRLLLGLFIIIYYKDQFFEVFENLVFILALISIPLFIIQIVYVDFFRVFQPISDTFLSSSRLNPSGREDIYTSHQYGFIYLVNQWSLFRNSGFMWEPAAYGGVLAWAMVFNAALNRFTFNSRLLVFLAAAITTFSIGTYIYISVFALAFLFYKQSIRRAFYLILTILLIGFMLFQFDLVERNVQMISEKVEAEQDLAQRIQSGNAPDRVSRLGGIIANAPLIVEMPIGYGLQYEYDIGVETIARSPNGLITLMRNWGWIALIILLFCAFKLIKSMGKKYELRLNSITYLLLMILVLLPIAGNPFYNQPLLFSIILSGMFLRVNHLQSYY